MTNNNFFIFYFAKQRVRTDIMRKHHHPNKAGTPGNLHPMPPNSKILLKKGNIYKKRGD
jgi:hypothetical protein